MKIGFVIGSRYDEDGKIIKVAYTWNEISTALKKGHVCPVTTKAAFDYIKLLERNKEFLEEVHSFRKKFGIPQEGYDYMQYPYEAFPYPNKSFMKMNKYLGNFKFDFAFDTDMGDLLSSGVFGSIQVLFNPIRVVYQEREKRLCIELYNKTYNRRKIEKETLLNIISENWPLIKKEMDNLPEFNLPRISKRDLKIYDLKEEGKSFYQIADILYNENYEENLSADAIRMAYNKIKRDIKSVFRRKAK